MAEAAKVREYTWFVEPLKDVSHCNAVIARALGEETSAENFCEQVRCLDGRKHNLWRCTHELAKSLWDSQRNLKISIRMWNREGNGAIRDCTVLFRKTMRRIIQQQQQQQQQQQRAIPQTS